MTITQLEYIIAVDNYRNFAKAASKCYITQPTLSMQIKKLEDELDVLVFDRSKKPVIPTEVGSRIIEQARLGLKDLNKIKDIINDHQDDLSGELRIGIIPTLSPYILPRFITNFVSSYPSVKLVVEELLSDQIAQKLSQDLLDLGLLVTPLNSQSIREIPLFYEAFELYLSPQHPLLAQEKIEASDLNYTDVWILKEGHCFRNQVIDLCTPGDNIAPRSLKFESGSIETLIKIVEKHFGYTLIPELAAMDLQPAQRKCSRPFNSPVPVREVSLVTHRSFLKEKLIMAFKEEILKSIPNEMKSRDRGNVIQWKK